MTPVESFAAEPPPLRMNGEGVILVGKTRVPLDTVVGEYEDGATPEHAEQVRRENEARFPPEGARERLLARRRSSQ